MVAINAGWVFETAQQALRRIDDSVGANLDSMSSESIQDISSSVSSLPGQVKVYVVDAKGETRFSTDRQVKPINITDREYFSALAQGEETHVSALLVSRLSGDQIFVISRRLERNGQFTGAAILSIDVAMMADFWQSLDLGPDSTVSLLRDDGALVARYPPAPGPQDLKSYVLFTDYLPKAPTGTYEALSPIDNISRIVGYRRVDGTHLVAIASVGMDAAFADFWENTRRTLFLAVPSAAGLAIVSIWIALLLRRDARRRDELTQALDTNRLLFREIHHRVKNNLQSIQSMVALQNIPPTAKLDMRSRIAAMAAVHEHLYRSDKVDRIEAAQYIPAIVDPLIYTYNGDHRVEYRIESLSIDHDRATPLGLLVNELVSNTLKHAFNDGEKGTITITLGRNEQGGAHLEIADDGVGFDPASVERGMGSRLIVGIAGQLQGEGHYEAGTTGSRYVLDFPLEDDPQRAFGKVANA